MKFAARPEETYAVVVGIEDYQVGSAWNLDGPALDAARFVQWLRKKTVPPDHIFAFLSPLDTNKNQVAEMCGEARVACNAAIGDDIRKVFAQTVPGKRGDLLITFWGGHGVVTHTRERRLFYANATAADKRHLVHESLLAAGRSRSYAGFPLQIGIVDACANYFEEMKIGLQITGDEIPAHTMPANGVRQLVLFASAGGEAALNNNLKRAGAFSEFLMQCLNEYDDFPGDFLAIMKQVKEHFERLRNEGRSRQTPVHYYSESTQDGMDEYGVMPGTGRMHEAARHTSISVEQVRSIVKQVLNCPSISMADKRKQLTNSFETNFRNAIFPLPEDSLAAVEKILITALNQDLLSEFFDKLALMEHDVFALHSAREQAERILLVGSAAVALRDVSIPEAELYKLYRASVPDAQVAPTGRSLDQMLEALAQMAPREQSGQRLVEFFERVNQKCPLQSIEEWLTKNSTGPKLAQIRAFLQIEKAQASRARPYLAVVVRTVRLKPGETPQIEAWLWNGSDHKIEHWLVDCQPSEDGLQCAVVGILKEARASTTSDLVVELLVPREQFCLAPEYWEISADEYSPASLLGTDHEVVLRWRERVYEPGKVRREDWIRRAALIEQRLDVGAPMSLLWVSAEKYSFHALRNDLVEKIDCGDCVGFLFVPPENPQLSKPDLVTAALIGGAPFLVWMRQEPENWSALREKLESVVQAGLKKLPRTIRDWRRSGDAVAGHSISVIWDSPEHLPKPERGTSCTQR